MKTLLIIFTLFCSTVSAQLYRHSSGSVTTPGSTPQQLLIWARVLSNAAWVVNNVSTTDNISGTMAQMNITSAGGSGCFQHFTSVGGHTYYWSFIGQLPPSGAVTDIKFSVYDYTHGADIIAPTSYYPSMSLSPNRVTFSFTTPAGCTDVGVYLNRDTPVTGLMWVGDPWVYDGSSKTFVPTTSTPVL